MCAHHCAKQNSLVMSRYQYKYVYLSDRNKYQEQEVREPAS